MYFAISYLSFSTIDCWSLSLSRPRILTRAMSVIFTPCDHFSPLLHDTDVPVLPVDQPGNHRLALLGDGVVWEATVWMSP